MNDFSWQTSFDSPEATARFAARFGDILNPGDVVLLTGDIGAGKTHLARHLIQSLMVNLEDVPSPTFTLVQVYETRKGTIQHADLYRLSSPNEVAELGLWDAFGTDICLVEWPDRLGHDIPKNALSITLTSGDDLGVRHAAFHFKDPGFATRFKEHFND